MPCHDAWFFLTTWNLRRCPQQYEHDLHYGCAGFALTLLSIRTLLIPSQRTMVNLWLGETLRKYGRYAAGCADCSMKGEWQHLPSKSKENLFAVGQVPADSRFDANVASLTS